MFGWGCHHVVKCFNVVSLQNYYVDLLIYGASIYCPRYEDRFVTVTFDGDPTADSELYNKLDRSIRDEHESQVSLVTIVQSNEFRYFCLFKSNLQISAFLVNFSCLNYHVHLMIVAKGQTFDWLFTQYFSR